MTGAALYMRLSRDDGSTESASIAGQRLLLRSWAREQGIPVAGEYIDDGVSGTTFDRPAFRRMIRDIELGKIDAVLVKDLSRLGRDYITAGQYTELWFPEHGVRFVAVNDGYDSDRADTDIAPLKNIINEMYARDTSRKIRSALRARMTAGAFTGARPPYGYRRSADNRSRLEPDPARAGVVQLIFSLAGKGHSRGQIARELNARGIPAPRGGDWGSSTIGKLLRDPVYLGRLAQGRSFRPTLKSRQSLPRPREDWIVVDDTHEALVSPEQFRLAGELISGRRACAGDFENIFSGIAFCADCGRAMSTVSTGKEGREAVLACGGYKAGGKAVCTNHFTDYSDLCELVLERLRDRLRLTQEQSAAIAGSALAALPVDAALTRCRRRLAETERTLSRLYADFRPGSA